MNQTVPTSSEKQKQSKTTVYSFDPNLTPPGENQRFIRNNKYFTICIYALIIILASAIIFKAIMDFDKTRAFFRQIFGMLAPFLFGALLAYILNPLVHAFYKLIAKCERKTKRKLKHNIHITLSILTAYMIVIGFITITLLFVIPELVRNITDFINYVPHVYDGTLKQLSLLQARFPNLDIQSIAKPFTDALPSLISAVRDMATNFVPFLYGFSMSVASWIVNLLITIIVSIYMIYDKRRLMRGSWRVIYAFVPEKKIPACHEIFSECNRIFSSFVVGKFIDSVIIGLLCFILMTIFQLSYAPLISLIVGVTNMIPYFGPFIGAIPGTLILLFIRPLQALIFIIMILCLQQFDGLILGPKILGDSTGMKPLWIIFSITIGGYVGGVIGMFLGVPLVAFISYLLDRYLTYRLRKKNVPESKLDEALGNLDLDD